MRSAFQSILSATILLFLAPAISAERASRIHNPFEVGKRQFEAGKHSRALDLFSQAIDSAPDSSHRNRAYYYQGLALFELGHYFSSYLAFRNVLLAADDSNKEIYDKAIKNAVIITDRMNRVASAGKVLDKLPPSFISSAVADMANYAIGVHQFYSDEDDKSMGSLKSVPPTSQFYAKAMFYLGVLATKKKNYKESIFYFEKVRDLSAGKRDKVALGELARLNLARSVYSSGDMERSIELYSRFLSSSPHWLTLLLEASWPLMRVNDTTVSLGNLHTVLSPFYRTDLVGEGYILRTTILYALCKYEEMRRTVSQFFTIYDPILRSMQAESGSLGTPEAYAKAFMTEKGLTRAFINSAKRDTGITDLISVGKLLREERRSIARYSRNEHMKRFASILDETEKGLTTEMGAILQKLHKRKLAELLEQREQANYLKVEIVTGEKELIETQKGLPPKRVVDVETSVAEDYNFWPYHGEYWEDELGSFVYTTESSCVN